MEITQIGEIHIITIPGMPTHGMIHGTDGILAGT